MAGIPEYWLVDACNDTVEFTIYQRGAKGGADAYHGPIPSHVEDSLMNRASRGAAFSAWDSLGKAAAQAAGRAR